MDTCCDALVLHFASGEIEGRVVLDILRTILQTAVAAGVPAHEYLGDVMREDPGEVAAHAERYTPLAWPARRVAEEA